MIYADSSRTSTGGIRKRMRKRSSERSAQRLPLCHGSILLHGVSLVPCFCTGGLAVGVPSHFCGQVPKQASKPNSF